MAIVVLDNFVDTNGTSLDAHTPDTRPGSNAWTEQVGNWQITSNRADLAAALNGCHATIDSGVADGTVSALVAHNTGSGTVGRDAGVVFRWQSTGNYWTATINEFGDTFRISEFISGTPTTRATTTLTIDESTYYTIAVALNGNDISATVNGGNELIYSSSTGATATVHGIYGRDVSPNCEIEWFQVEDAGSGSVTGSGAVTFGAMAGSGAGALAVQGNAAAMFGAMTGAGVSGHGDIVTYTLNSGDAALLMDNTITNTAPDYNLGAHDNFEADGGPPQHGLMRFILSAIPTGKTCVDAVLHLFKTTSTSVVPMTMTAYEISEANGDWIPGTKDLEPATTGESTYNHKAHPSTNWAGSAGCATPETDYDPSALGSFTFNSGDAVGTHYMLSLDAVTVQTWFGEATNNGILLIPTGGNGRHLGWSEQGTAGYRPYLVVRYFDQAGPVGVGGIAFGEMVGSAAGALAIQATGGIVFGAMAGSASGTLPAVAEGAVAFGVMVGSAAGALEIRAAGAATFDAMSGAGTGVVGGTITTGAGAVALEAMIGSAAGALEIRAAGAAVFGAMAGGAEGTLEIRAAGAVIFGTMAGSGEGELDIQGVGAVLFGAMTAMASGILYSGRVGAGAITFAAMVGSAIGIVSGSGVSAGHWRMSQGAERVSWATEGGGARESWVTSEEA